MVRYPDKDQEGQLTNQYVEPHKDVKKERPHALVPKEKGDGASIEHREESLSTTRPAKVRKEYGFRLLDPATNKVAQDWQWLSTREAREHVIRQSMSSGQFIIERSERKTPT